MNLDFDFKRTLPLIGILAFSLCSVWSLYHLFSRNAIHPTPLYWGAAVLTEIITGWAIYQTVEQARRVLQSNISRQDKRFYGLTLTAFVLVAIPTLGASIVANTIEFGGNVLLGCLFPVASIGCAVGVALPSVATQYEKKRKAEQEKRKAEVKRRKEEAKKAQAERKAEVKREQERRKMLSKMGNARATYEQIVANPTQSQANIAQTLSITRQSVGNHMAKLEQMGAIKRNNGGAIEVLWG